MVAANEMEFYCAATAGNMAVVDRFVAQDGNVTVQSFAGHTVLHGACNVNKPGVVQALLTRPTIRQQCLDLRDHRHHWTPLQTCIAVGHDDLALLLVQQYHADVSNVDDEKRSALHLACYYNSSLRLIQCLLQKMDRDKTTSLQYQPDQFGKTPLLYACDHANVPVVQHLLGNHCYHQQGVVATPSCWQFELGHVRGALSIPAYHTVVRLMLNAGVSIQPILHCTRPYKIHQEFLVWIQALLHDHAQNVRTAAAQGNVQVLQSLLSSRRQQQEWLQPCPETHWTALHGAARHGHVAACSVLLHAGASPWVVDQDGVTPLQLAVHYEHLEVVQEFLRHSLLNKR